MTDEFIASYGATNLDKNSQNDPNHIVGTKISRFWTKMAAFISIFITVSFLFILLSVDSSSPLSGNSILQLTTSVSIKPNIIFILADDMGYSALGVDGYTDELLFATPVLNGLVEKSLVMKNYYAQEVCTPARAALLTGRYPLSVGMQYFMVQSAIPWGLPLRESTLAEVLKADGYRTHMLGKWHLGHFSPRYLPTARGFETFTGMLNGESYYWSKRNVDHSHFKDFIISDTSCYSPYEEDDLHDYSTYMYRDMAVDIINNHDQSDPLFLYLSFQAVHDPFTDVSSHDTGVPTSYLSDDIASKIQESVSVSLIHASI